MDLENSERGIVERIDPRNVPQGILSVHAVRYHFAAPYCAGRVVADIACGAGYGSAILAKSATSVIGVDADRVAVDFAREHYAAPNLTFDVMDALNLGITDGSVDVLVSFETIEHLTDIERFLREVTRVLAPGGVFIVSTPLVAATNLRPENPHHAIEFSLPDFESLLRRHFAGVELYGQSRVQTNAHRVLQRLDVLGLRHIVPAFLRRGATKALATVPYEDMGLESQQIVRAEFRRAHDIVAVCTVRASLAPH